MTIHVNVKDHVLKPIDEVFDAIVNPVQMTRYFASSASGWLKKGDEVTWEFADVNVMLKVLVLEVEENNRIIFEWVASGQLAKVDIILHEENNHQTNIEIIEGSFDQDEGGIQKALQQTQGWTDFICSMKAYLYTGVNLRIGRTKK